MKLNSRVAKIAQHLHRWRKRYVLVSAGIFCIYLLFGWLALPGIVQSQAQRFISERTGHQLSMDKPEFNPFRLSLRLKNLRLAEPDGKPLLAFKELLVDLSASSLFRRTYVFDDIQLDGLEATAVALPNGKFNWSPLLNAFQSKEEKTVTNAALPRIDIDHFLLSGARITFADRRSHNEITTQLEPIDLELSDISTLPNDKGLYSLKAKTGFGALIHWDGEVTVNPLAINGNLGIEALALAKLEPYVQLPPKIAAPQGTLNASAHYRVAMNATQLDVQLDNINAKLSGLKLQGTDEKEPALTLDTIELKNGKLDLRQRQVAIQAIVISGGHLNLLRGANGRLNLQELIAAAKAPPTAAKASKQTTAVEEKTPAAAAAPWHYRLEQLSLNGLAASFHDQTIKPAAEVALQDINMNVSGISENKNAQLPVSASFHAKDGGSFTAEGKLTPATAAVDLQIKLEDLALKPAQSYIGSLTTLRLADGRVSSHGHASFDAKGGQYAGSFAVNNLRLLEADGKQTFLAWKSLSSQSLSLMQNKLSIRELLLDGLDTRLIIGKDKSINVSQIMRKPATPGSATTASAAGAETVSATKKSAESSFSVGIRRLRLSRGKLEFADHSLAMPFGTKIKALNGNILNISSQRNGAPARIKIEGQVDDFGMARSEGQFDLFNPTDSLALKVAFTNVEMAHLTPYSATFAGRKIDSGKLSLNLEYKIRNRQLSGDNQVIMDQLTLGERIESPQAKNLPLDLAIAILQDSDGRIDLGLPVSGNLDDPQFSYGQIVWKAILNVLSKIATAPFRALGGLFGSSDKIDGLMFEAGQGALTPPEREKLLRFAAVLNKRPKLAIALHGTWSETDRVTLQDLALRRAIAGKLGLSTEGDPGIISPDQPKVKSALEDLTASNLGRGELAALREGYAQANPGQIEVTTGGKMMSMLTGVLGKKRTLSEEEITRMKGEDFHAMLYQRLRNAENISDEKLNVLAKTRGETIFAGLQAAKAPMTRISLQAPEKIEANGNLVPVKFDMQAIPKDGGHVEP